VVVAAATVHLQLTTTTVIVEVLPAVPPVATARVVTTTTVAEVPLLVTTTTVETLTLVLPHLALVDPLSTTMPLLEAALIPLMMAMALLLRLVAMRLTPMLTAMAESPGRLESPGSPEKLETLESPMAVPLALLDVSAATMLATTADLTGEQLFHVFFSKYSGQAITDSMDKIHDHVIDGTTRLKSDSYTGGTRVIGMNGRLR
jgi:hypothetical protein